MTTTLTVGCDSHRLTEALLRPEHCYGQAWDAAPALRPHARPHDGIISGLGQVAVGLQLELVLLGERQRVRLFTGQLDVPNQPSVSSRSSRRFAGRAPLSVELVAVDTGSDMQIFAVAQQLLAPLDAAGTRSGSTSRTSVVGRVCTSATNPCRSTSLPRLGRRGGRCRSVDVSGRADDERLVTAPSSPVKGVRRVGTSLSPRPHPSGRTGSCREGDVGPS